MRLIIDTDAGIDDSVAIMLANSVPGVEIAAITTCFGTASLANTTRNALGLCALIGLRTRVAAGASVPMIIEPRPVGGFHGRSGVGEAKLPPPEPDIELDAAYAWDVIYEEAREERVTIVTLGPLTNLATALLRYADLPEYVDKIVIMGGSHGAGNAGRFAEANIAHDPHACEIVLRSGVPIVMAGLNATETTRLSTAEWNRIFSKQSGVSDVLRGMFATYKHSQNMCGETGLVIHDAAAMFAGLYTDAARGMFCRVECETSPSPMYARTIADVRPFADGARNAEVLTLIDRERYIAALDAMLDYYS
ncbi:MAG: nucleoside hydrolase [Clostridiales bacterium]|jgi:inosine-uridine nucleoside N-ribohydrolase|nr:nucleoside hydrolase [Clostridiales bacterium]